VHAEHLGNGFALRVRLVSPSRESMVRNVAKEESAPRHPIPRLAGGGTTKPTEPQPPAASRSRRYCVPGKEAPASPAASRSLLSGHLAMAGGRSAARRRRRAANKEGKEQPCRVPAHARDMCTATGAASLRDARLVPCLSSSGRRLEWKNERFTSSAR